MEQRDTITEHNFDYYNHICQLWLVSFEHEVTMDGGMKIIQNIGLARQVVNSHMNNYSTIPKSFI